MVLAYNSCWNLAIGKINFLLIVSNFPVISVILAKLIVPLRRWRFEAALLILQELQKLLENYSQLIGNFANY